MHSCKFLRIVLTFMLLAVFTPRTQAAAQDWCDMNSCATEGTGLRVYGDYLYWKVTQDHMDYAAIIPGGFIPIIDAFSSGKPFDIVAPLNMREPSFDYQSGFKVGVGYTVPCSDWDFDLCWTRLNENIKSSVSDATGGIVPVTFPASIILGILDSSSGGTFALGTGATSNWRFEYNVVDLEVGKKMNFCNCVAFRPFVGVKFASIRQKQYINYLGFELINPTSPTVPVGLTNFKKNDFRGVGPSFGFDAAWQFLPDWNLTSGVCGALVYGKFDVHHSPTVNLMTDTLTIAIQDSRNCRFSPTVNGNIGIDWETTFCDSFQVKIGVAYEVQYWWNQWHPTSTVASTLISGSSAPYGDLMMQGLTVQASFGF